MSNTVYDIVWKKGSFFEKGGFQLTPRNTGGNGAIVFAIIIIAIIVIVVSIAILIIPVLSILIGFQLVREKRYVAGVISIIGLVYFLIDLNNGWVSEFLFGIFKESISKDKYIFIFKFANFSATGLGVWFIIDSIIFENMKEKYMEKKLLTEKNEKILRNKEKEQKLLIEENEKISRNKEMVLAEMKRNIQLKKNISLSKTDSVFRKVSLKVIKQNNISISRLLFDSEISFERLLLILSQLEVLGIISPKKENISQRVLIKDEKDLNIIFEYLDINY